MGSGRREETLKLVRRCLPPSLRPMNDQDPEEDLTLGATFPPPPSHHLKFTDHNLRLLALLTNGQASPSASSSSPTPFDPKGKQREILKDEEDVPDWDLQVELTAPRVDWIEAGGEYEMYGSTYFVSSTLLPLSLPSTP